MQSIEGSQQLASNGMIPLRTVLEGAWKSFRENAIADYGSVRARVLEDVKGGSRDE